MAPTRLTALLTASSMLLTTVPAWATDVAQATDAPAAPTTSLQFDNYRTMSGSEYRDFARHHDIDLGSFMSCVDSTETGRRERAVTARMPLVVQVDGEGVVSVRYTGEEDNDATPDDDETVQDCVDGKVEGAEWEPVEEQFHLSQYSWIYYDDNYFTQRRKRHSEIIALYTLSAVSLGTGIGALVAAGNDRDDASDDSDFSLQAGDPDRSSLNERADRFRIAGWTMIGVSAVSFIGADILLIRNRRIEQAENPYFAASPVGPGGTLGLSFSGRF